MEINFDMVNVIYPNENSPELRKVNIVANGENLQINILDDTLDSICISLEKHEVELLSDTLNLILKNKLVAEIED